MQIDFYLLQNTQSQNQFACRLIDKIYELKQHVYIHTASAHDAKALDQLLWTYRDSSFIPHQLLDNGIDPEIPVSIGYQAPPAELNDVLINLSPNRLEVYQQFKRMLIIVPNEDGFKAAAREQYRHYQQEEHQLNTHKIN